MRKLMTWKYILAYILTIVKCLILEKPIEIQDAFRQISSTVYLSSRRYSDRLAVTAS